MKCLRPVAALVDGVRSLAEATLGFYIGKSFVHTTKAFMVCLYCHVYLATCDMS